MKPTGSPRRDRARIRNPGKPACPRSRRMFVCVRVQDEGRAWSPADLLRAPFGQSRSSRCRLGNEAHRGSLSCRAARERRMLYTLDQAQQGGCNQATPTRTRKHHRHPKVVGAIAQATLENGCAPSGTERPVSRVLLRLHDAARPWSCLHLRQRVWDNAPGVAFSGCRAGGAPSRHRRRTVRLRFTPLVPVRPRGARRHGGSVRAQPLPLPRGGRCPAIGQPERYMSGN